MRTKSRGEKPRNTRKSEKNRSQFRAVMAVVAFLAYLGGESVGQAALPRSADFQSAVSQVSNLQSPAPTIQPSSASGHPLSPTALVASRDGHTLFIACGTGNRVLRFDTAEKQVPASISLPGSPSGLAWSAEGNHLFVTCAAPLSKLCLIDVATGRVVRTLTAGHTSMAPVLISDGSILSVCNRFNNDVSLIPTNSRGEPDAAPRIPVLREPVAADSTPDGRFLLVANHLHNGRSDADRVAAAISIIDLTTRKTAKELLLPDGSGCLNDLRVSPDGKYAVVTHILSRFRLPATQLDRGWMNDNAASIIDLARLEILNTVLLDNVDRGAANPWGIAWSADGALLAITHAGTHEVSLIDFPGLLAKLAKVPATLDSAKPADPAPASRIQADVPNDLSFLVGVRQRLKLPVGDLGPRAITFIGRTAYVANYFSDTLTRIDCTRQPPHMQSILLGPRTEPSIARRGEFYFHDASLCFQGWQSCSTCHPGQARVDGLNWDLLNDGIGNPKNVKSLLLAHRTPPAMSTGVRETAESAVRAGIRHILFTVQPEETAVAIDTYLKSLEPVPSPHLVKGRLSPAAVRGEKLFKDPRVGCATCHPPGLFTDLHHYDVGTCGSLDHSADQFDTPTLIELWRTAPYLHDGSAATLREVLTSHNSNDRHGKTSHLTAQQIEELETYLLSL